MEPPLHVENVWEVKAPLTTKVKHTNKRWGYIMSKAFGLKGRVGGGFGGNQLGVEWEKREV